VKFAVLLLAQAHARTNDENRDAVNLAASKEGAGLRELVKGAARRKNRAGSASA
jgi:hypothetical protein